jgi:hypothetical protein
MAIMANQNVDGVLTGRGLMDCLQYYDNCLFFSIFSALLCLDLVGDYFVGMSSFKH